MPPGSRERRRRRSGEEAHAPIWTAGRAAAVLAAATALIAWMSEILVGAIEPMTHESGLNRIFVSVFVVAILGNAAEHATAITAALKNRMDLSLSIAIGSSIQVALFVAPVLVLASLVLGPAPMDLAFPTGLVLIVFLSVLITAQVAGDGRSDWLKGVQLLVRLPGAGHHLLLRAGRGLALMTGAPPAEICDPVALDRPSFRDQDGEPDHARAPPRKVDR